jgi:hypothetical protein
MLERPTVTTVTSLGDLDLLSGDCNDPVLAARLRDLLIDRGLLVWRGDRHGGILTVTDAEWDRAITDWCAETNEENQDATTCD